VIPKNTVGVGLIEVGDIYEYKMGSLFFEMEIRKLTYDAKCEYGDHYVFAVRKKHLFSHNGLVKKYSDLLLGEKALESFLEHKKAIRSYRGKPLFEIGRTRNRASEKYGRGYARQIQRRKEKATGIALVADQGQSTGQGQE